MSNSTIDQQFIEFIVKTIVGNPDAVVVKRTIDEKGVLLELTVDPEDLGRVIGKRGSGAQALRTLLRALGTKNDARYNLKIVDVNEGERPARQEKPTQDNEDQQTPEVADEVHDEEPDAPAEQPAEEAADDEPEESDVAAKTRRELADLDDLDI